MNEQRAKEPSTAPQAEQWYPLELGASFQSPSSSRFYSLRYEFKPASIDTSRPGSLHKSSDSKVTVEFLNNQPGKSKVSFQGNIEECKELDSILIFDGKSFRLEHLHKAVKSLRHVRLPGENSNNNSALAAGGTSNADHPSPPLSLNGAAPSAPLSNFHIERIPDKGVSVQVEEIVLGPTDTSAGKNNGKRKKVETKLMEIRSSPEEETASVAKSNHEVQIEVDEVEEEESGKRAKLSESQMIQNVVDEIFEEHESDYEIEHVDVSEDEGVVVNAAEALRAQTAAEKQKQQSSSESGSTRSGSSGSDSGSSSSGSDGSDDDEDSASSGDDV